MANTGLIGPFVLTSDSVNQTVTLKSPGTYALGNSTGATFFVKYVGRSDDDVNSRLKNWVGKYAQFKFGYYNSPKAAFEKECGLYHDFNGDQGGLDNTNHPQRPAGTNWQCPGCNVLN